MKTWHVFAALAALALVLTFTATGALYFTGPTKKTVHHAQKWSPGNCIRNGWSMTPDPPQGACPYGFHWVPGSYYTPESERRTSAWERISGALTGSGNFK
jgi:hypothetical protein